MMEVRENKKGKDDTWSYRTNRIGYGVILYKRNVTKIERGSNQVSENSMEVRFRSEKPLESRN